MPEESRRTLTLSLAEVRYQIHNLTIGDGVDPDELYRDRWFHRPFAGDELEEHPESDRLLSTIRATEEEVVRRIRDELLDWLEDLAEEADEDAQPGTPSASLEAPS
jgi:hypothetical protein